ncbi:cytochrome P450 [Mycobacterium heidelbergense]|uniref:Cytochrome P450 n=1 Tax=Mycobacterium heidelbergense TaxID=53376 RepID=A0A1X0DJ93_MYCHE|nr:cytochrome P450 [Mycobacterium avium]MCV7052081.1 cytochrome P450 [Mycobacterium heidelbergense]OIN81438.1 cytochrome [Mycobacterium malmoense]ORA72476.1 cytochrome P450 [Mycobacterium heidelbergense]ORV43849.1 cytochrome [Mycobacterium conspicuum]
MLEFEPFSPGPPERLPELYAALRERFPVYRTSSNIWVISRFDDVKAVQSNPAAFSSRPNPYEGDSPPPDAEMKPEVIERLMALTAGIPVDLNEMASAKTIAAADPPQHTRMRRIVSRGFTPPRIKEMATAISEIVDRCLSGIRDLPSFDLVERLAVPLPVEMICHILGIDRSEYGRAKRWSDAFAAAAGGVFSSPVERNELMLSTVKEFGTYFVPLIEARRVEPRSDLVSAMVGAIDNESLSTVETLMMAITIMVAGNETTTNLIGNTVVELLANPDQLQLLLDDPSLLPNAVDEANRLTAPIQFAFREATEETEVAGTTIPKGAIVALHMAAANRDPRRFEDPDRFLITRPATKNLSFGHGIHFCLGAHLAGQEARTAIGGLLPYLDRLKLTGAPLQRNPTALLNGWQRIELAWVS